MKKITIICEDGWKYTGKQIKEKYSVTGSLEWIEIQTHNGPIKVHAKYIVSIIDQPK